MHLSGLFIYPVKSLRGLAVTEARVDDFGLVGDRRFLVVDDQNQFLTQRALPRMALIETELGGDSLILRNPHHGSAAVSLTEPGAPLTVQVWRDTVIAESCSVEIDVWLSDFLRQPCRLVRLGQKFSRPIPPHKLPALSRQSSAGASAEHVVSFADAYPFLSLGEASLADLNDRLIARGEDPLPMNRFRPNLVIAGSPAFAEDTWPRFRIGDITFRAAGPCARCIVTTTDQQTAERGKEPLRTLSTYRRDAADPTDINFGQNLVHETKSGTLRVGDPLVVAS